MATIERDGLMTTKDAQGNLNLVYLATKKDNIVDLEVATQQDDGLLSSSDKRKFDQLVQSNKYVFGSDENGVYLLETENYTIGSDEDGFYLMTSILLS